MIETLTAHVIVKNEEKWIWFSLLSVLDYVDEYIIFDTGSTDLTRDIIQAFVNKYSCIKKIKFFEKGSVSKENFYKLRQEQIDLTQTPWFLVLDGDEIWYKDTIAELVNSIQNPLVSLIAVKFHNAVSDIYHYKNFESENYTIKNITGSITIRAYRKGFRGIHCSGDYGVEGYFDSQGTPIQKIEDSIFVLEGIYFHASYLQRSSSLLKDWEIPYRRNKVFAKAQSKVKKNFEFPHVFNLQRPEIVSSPFKKRNFKYHILRILHLIHVVFSKVKSHF